MLAAIIAIFLISVAKAQHGEFVCSASLSSNVVLANPNVNFPGQATSAAQAGQNTQNLLFADPVDHYWADIDDRQSGFVFGTPGGDLGEFLNGLNAYIQNGGAVPSQFVVYELLLDYLTIVPADRHFYFSTDPNSLSSLLSMASARLGYTVSKQTLMSPRNATEQNVFLSLVSLPQNIGCDHFRLMIQNPSLYKQNTTIVSWLLQAYFQYIWNWDQTNQAVLYNVTATQAHSATGVLQVFTDRSATYVCDTAPDALVSPRSSGPGGINYVLTPEAVQELRLSLATYFAIKREDVFIDPDMLHNVMNNIAAVQTAATLSFLAPNLPVYNVTILATGVVYQASAFQIMAASAFAPLLTLFLMLVLLNFCYAFLTVRAKRRQQQIERKATEMEKEQARERKDQQDALEVVEVSSPTHAPRV